MPTPHLTARPLLSVFIGMALLAGLSGSAVAQTVNRAAVERSFQVWVEKLWPDARKKGVSRATFRRAMAGVRLDWTLPDLRPPGYKPGKSGPRRQREFGSPGPYFKERDLKLLTKRGREKRKIWDKTLRRISKTYGVPVSVILAVWGRETSFGAVKVRKDAIRVLATQGFIGRRAPYFRRQLILAMVILEQGHIKRRDMKSSWAGAMGKTQMLPSSFLRFAVDFDGDGRKNIWTSVPDSLATSANFLKQSGWGGSHSWGYEVVLPRGFDCRLEHPDKARTIGEWLKTGLQRTHGRQFNIGRLETKARLLLPAGLYGPAFLVTNNFFAVKRYNPSDLYALYVGQLADRMSTDRPFAGKWQKVSTYTRAKVKKMQVVLKSQGLDDSKKIDGLLGTKTRVAIGRYQHKHGLKRDCWPGRQTFSHAGVR